MPQINPVVYFNISLNPVVYRCKINIINFTSMNNPNIDQLLRQESIQTNTSLIEQFANGHHRTSSLNSIQKKRNFQAPTSARNSKKTDYDNLQEEEEEDSPGELLRQSRFSFTDTSNTSTTLEWGRQNSYATSPILVKEIINTIPANAKRVDLMLRKKEDGQIGMSDSSSQAIHNSTLSLYQKDNSVIIDKSFNYNTAEKDEGLELSVKKVSPAQKVEDMNKDDGNYLSVEDGSFIKRDIRKGLRLTNIITNKNLEETFGEALKTEKGNKT